MCQERTNKERELDSCRMKQGGTLRLSGMRCRLVGTIIHPSHHPFRRHALCVVHAKRRKKTHLVVSATSRRNAVDVVSHLPDERRVSLVGDKVLESEALEISPSNPPSAAPPRPLPVNSRKRTPFDVVEERVLPVVRCQSVRLLRRGGGRVVRGHCSK